MKAEKIFFQTPWHKQNNVNVITTRAVPLQRVSAIASPLSKAGDVKTTSEPRELRNRSEPNDLRTALICSRYQPSRFRTAHSPPGQRDSVRRTNPRRPNRRLRQPTAVAMYVGVLDRQKGARTYPTLQTQLFPFGLKKQQYILPCSRFHLLLDTELLCLSWRRCRDTQQRQRWSRRRTQPFLAPTGIRAKAHM
jgi:hypothetical protein